MNNAVSDGTPSRTASARRLRAEAGRWWSSCPPGAAPVPRAGGRRQRSGLPVPPPPSSSGRHNWRPPPPPRRPWASAPAEAPALPGTRGDVPGAGFAPTPTPAARRRREGGGGPSPPRPPPSRHAALHARCAGARGAQVSRARQCGAPQVRDSRRIGCERARTSRGARARWAGPRSSASRGRRTP